MPFSVPDRPVDPGTILTGALEAYIARPLVFAPIYAAVQVPLTLGAVVLLAIVPDADFERSALAVAVIEVVGNLLLVLPLVAAASAWALGELESGRSVTAAGALAAAVARSAPLIGAALLAGVATGLGLVAFVLPGLVIAIFLTFSAPAVMLEGLAATAALRRSAQLVRGRFWRTLGALVLLVVVTTLPQVALTFFVPVEGMSERAAAIALTLVGGVGAVLVGPVQAIALTLIFRDLRLRHKAG